MTWMIPVLLFALIGFVCDRLESRGYRGWSVLVAAPGGVLIAASIIWITTMAFAS